MRSFLCVPIIVHTKADALADAELARAQGASLVEFRMDQVMEGAGSGACIALSRGLCEASPLPVIVTCRSLSEGGLFGGDLADLEAWTRAMLDGTVPRPPRYVDVEFAALRRSGVLRSLVHEQGDPDRPGVILSTHDFSGPPADLSRRMLAMAQTGGVDVIKVAYTARSLRDALGVLALPAELGRPTIALAMGEFGVLSRVLAPKFGGFLTFAALREGSGTAPGQPTLASLRDQYRFDRIGPDTRVFGIIGWPVAHSRSPLVHNAGFGEVGFEGVYLPMPVAAGDDAEASYVSCKATVLELLGTPGLSFAGASVTIPHKENLARLARERGWEVDESVRGTGAANTLVVPPLGSSGPPRVLNTDAPAIASCLSRVVGSVAGECCVVLGAGGVARAAAWALAREKARVVIINRSQARAAQLACEISRELVGANIRAGTLLDLSVAACVVHATPLGMQGGPAPAGSFLDPGLIAKLPGTAVVFDTVYVPVETPLVRAARARGLRVITGEEMFVAQAALQFEAWTGEAAPREVFARVVAASLRANGGGH